MIAWHLSPQAYYIFSFEEKIEKKNLVWVILYGFCMAMVEVLNTGYSYRI